MTKNLFIVSIPHERGIVQYDVQGMLSTLPEGFRVTNQEPDMNVTVNEILFTWECEQVVEQDPKNYTAGVIIGKRTRNNRY